MRTAKTAATDCFRDMVGLITHSVDRPPEASALQFLYNACAEMNDWETPSQLAAKAKQGPTIGGQPSVMQSQPPASK